MVKLELRIAKETAEKIKKADGNLKFLLGWEESNALVCVECVNFGYSSENDLLDLLKDDTQGAFRLFPAGIGVIGLFRHCSDEEATGRAQNLLTQLLGCGAEVVDSVPTLFFTPIVQSFLAVHVSLKEINCIASSLLAFMYSDPDSSRCLIYDSATETSSPARVVFIERPRLFSDRIRLRTTGEIKLEFETSDDIAATLSNLDKAFEKIAEKISSAAAIFQMLNTNLLLRNKDYAADFSHPKLKPDSRCSALASVLYDDDDDGIQNLKDQCFGFRLWFKSTGEDAIMHTVSCVPIIHVERRSFNVAIVNLAVDVICYVSRLLPVANLPVLFVNGIQSQLIALQSALVTFYKEKGKFFAPKVYHFRCNKQDPILSVIYPEGLDDSELEPHRRKIHEHLTLPLDQPLFRRVQSVSFPFDSTSSGHLYDVHSNLPLPSTDGQIATVKGSYAYHHYMQDRFDDDGWGCAYRSLQTLISWFRCQGYTNEPIPSHRKIQETLVEIGDKPKSFVNSRQWIGSMEVSYCLDKLIGISSRIMFVNSGAEMTSKARELLNHFYVHGTPIMIGGGVYAHTILGIYFNEKTGDTKFLILDPHYTGSEDLKTIQSKGWCGWKGPKFWNQTAHYNLCCPQRPSGI